jgi:hypothetical protein
MRYGIDENRKIKGGNDDNAHEAGGI